ncbi:MAG: hypothetical protein JSR77_03640 [Planctomycetes bacterium]|nr:hypothetical protein [Planctomycetota bacterium]
MSYPARHNLRQHLGLPAAIFAFALWWLAFAYLRGDLGLYSDDWAAHVTDPVTGAARWDSPVFLRNYFWRPALQIFLHYAFLLCWHQLWVLHLLNAVAHGVAAALLYRLLRRLDLIPHAAFAGAMVFMLLPFHYEVVFWTTAMTTGIPAGLTIALCLIVARYAREHVRSLKLHIFFALFTFFIMCWYEQPAALVGAFPFLYMAARPAHEKFLRSLARITALLASCGVGMAVYVACIVTTAPPTVRGGSQSLISSPAEAIDRVRIIFKSAQWHFTSKLADSLIGGLHTAWSLLNSPTGAATIACIGIVGGLFLSRWQHAPVPPMSAAAPARRAAQARWLWTLLFGVTAFTAAWGPIVVIRNQIIEARTCYAVGIGLAVVVAALVHGLLRSTRRFYAWPALHAAAGICVALASMLAAVSMLGAQASMQNRARTDARQLGQLAAAFSKVPPGTVFVPLEDSFAAGSSGRAFFDRVLFGWTGASWSAVPALQITFHRTDVFATAINPWIPLLIEDIDAQGFRYPLDPFRNMPVHPKGGAQVAWSNTIPFTIDRAGNVHIVTRLLIRAKDGRETVVEPPLAKAAGAGRDFRLAASR